MVVVVPVKLRCEGIRCEVHKMLQQPKSDRVKMKRFTAQAQEFGEEDVAAMNSISTKARSDTEVEK